MREADLATWPDLDQTSRPRGSQQGPRIVRRGQPEQTRHQPVGDLEADHTGDGDRVGGLRTARAEPGGHELAELRRRGRILPRSPPPQLVGGDLGDGAQVERAAAGAGDGLACRILVQLVDHRGQQRLGSVGRQRMEHPDLHSGVRQ